ncbi:MAG: vanadium-dependent haloperoxidase [Xenococcus sp. MO_188.B8]|nr:vanadium-dependent haloperoxidase [Xenococcus sp. MO_188.B8]
MNSNFLSNFLNREKLEKLNLTNNFLFGKFLELKYLRKLRVQILRLRATLLTDCEIEHQNNGDEAKFQNKSFVGSFTKGLPHDETGRVKDPEQFKRFRVATHRGDFSSDPQLQLGKEPEKNGKIDWRAVDVSAKNAEKPILGWESPSAGLTFEMHGPDSHTVTMPPAPPLGSDQLTFEMAEVYWLALLRDVPFNQFQESDEESALEDAVKHLNALSWLQEGMPTAPNLARRQRKLQSDQLDKQTIFRGATPGDIVGPYLSQFLLIGTRGPEGRDENITNGLIDYGALKIDQKVISASQGLDHMTTWDVFLDVQDGANLKKYDEFEQNGALKRFITTPRDLATYVHFDALYEAYLNACLILLGFDAPVDPGIRQLNNLFSDQAKEASASGLGRVNGFALFGGPHILNLVTEVATRALKAVRYQKFNVHCRLRPEALAGWMEAINQGTTEITDIEPLKQMYDVLNATLDEINLLERIKTHNGEQNSDYLDNRRPYVKVRDTGAQTALLPMAFPEGSPMHPAYGAGHATVAGACVTMLKAFFDTDAVFGCDCHGDLKITSQDDYDKNQHTPVAYRPCDDGLSLENTYEASDKPLTVGDELNKIAANISIGRNMAGVHYYTDYIDSLVMGEKIAIGILLEQSLAYEIYPKKVRPSFSLTTFLGKTLKIKDGKIFEQICKVPEDYKVVKWCDL